MGLFKKLTENKLFESVNNAQQAIKTTGKLISLISDNKVSASVREMLQGLKTIIDKVEDPSFAAVCGLIMWSRTYAMGGAGSGGSTNKLLEHANVLKLKRWFKSFLP